MKCLTISLILHVEHISLAMRKPCIILLVCPIYYGFFFGLKLGFCHLIVSLLISLSFFWVVSTSIRIIYGKLKKLVRTLFLYLLFLYALESIWYLFVWHLLNSIWIFYEMSPDFDNIYNFVKMKYLIHLHGVLYL